MKKAIIADTEANESQYDTLGSLDVALIERLNDCGRNVGIGETLRGKVDCWVLSAESAACNLVLGSWQFAPLRKWIKLGGGFPTRARDGTEDIFPTNNKLPTNVPSYLPTKAVQVTSPSGRQTHDTP